MAGSSLNKVTLIGNVGQDPEVRVTGDERVIANFSMATSENWKDKNTGERKEKTEWHRVVVFNEALAKVVKSFVKKGSRLYIEGQLQTRRYVDSSGQERTIKEVVLQFNSQLIILDPRQGGASQPVAETTATATAATATATAKPTKPANFDNSELDDEIPF